MSNPFKSGGTDTPTIAQRLAALGPGQVSRDGTIGAAPSPASIAPTPPGVTPPAVMPSLGSKPVNAAGQRAVQTIAARAGRTSTMLTKKAGRLGQAAGATAATAASDLYNRTTLG